MEFVGKPLYLALSSLIIIILSIIYWGRQLIKKVTLPPIKLPDLKAQVKILRLKISLLIIRLPKPRFRLKIRLSFIFLFAIMSVSIFLFWLLILKDLPSPRELITRDQEVSTKIYDRNGVLLYKIFKDKNRTLASLENIPIHVRLATLAAEDAEFYGHPGFSIRGIFRSAVRNLTKGELTGGSTITQQLVKNALLSSEKTYIRKVREIVLAIGVELTFTKDEILEMYLNEVSYGGTAYGIQEASQYYFDKDTNQLTLAEAALLVGLPKSPTKFSPFGPSPGEGINRQKDIVNLMVVNKFISQELADKTISQPLSFADNKTNIKAPHFVMFVRQALEERLGKELVEKGGLEVITTLDYSIQKMAEEVVQKEVERLSPLKVGNGAALVLNPKNGEILAMVGSKDYFDTNADGNVNVTTRSRPPGSSIKVVNYAYALANGYTPATILSDTPVAFSVPGQNVYRPRNYDGQFKGNLTLRDAFAQSINVTAVKTLASYGVDKMIEQGKLMGITTWDDKSRFGLSLTLGGGEVKLIDLAQVYATVANYGKRPEINSVLEITNYRGKSLGLTDCEKEIIKPVLAAEAQINDCATQVLDSRVAYLLIDILKDNAARSPTFGSYSLLNISGHPEVAVKTGTSNDLRDNLAVGFNQDYLVAVWVGNNDNSPMARVASGITGATPIFNQIMSGLLAEHESKDWVIPEGISRIQICPLTGTLPCRGCPTRTELFLEENQPKYACRTEQVLAQIESRKKEGEILEEAASTVR